MAAGLFRSVIIAARILPTEGRRIMMRSVLHVLVFAALLLFPISSARAFGGGGCGEGACAECHSFEKEEAEQLLKGLVEKVHSVDFATVPGLWEAVVEAQGQKGSVYIDFSKSYLISGKVLRLADWTDISAGKPAAPRKIDTSRLSTADSLIMGSAVAAKKIYVFTDPQCPYCQKLHEELKKIVAARKDIAFVLKLFPLASHPDAYRLSKSVLCASSLGLLEDSFAGNPVPDPSCETDAVDKTLVLAKELEIRSTPTLIMPDGRVLPGYKTADKLIEIIDAPPPGEASP